MISIRGHEYHGAQSSYHFHDLTYQGFCKTRVSHGNKALSSIAETNSWGLDAFNHVKLEAEELKIFCTYM
jgi:hypothetical protein